jgi:hypothetical protein
MVKTKTNKLRNGRGRIIKLNLPEARLKRFIRAHFTRLGFTKAEDGTLVPPDGGKEVIRELHATQRRERLGASAEFLKEFLPLGLPRFADGREVEAGRIQLVLQRVQASTFESDCESASA